MTPGHTKENPADFLEVISPQEIESLRLAAKDGLRHPVAALAHASDNVAANTKRAARNISRSDKKWLSSLKPRLIDVSSFTNASATLGEVRAYGALLEAAITVKPHPVVPGKRVKPEFEADAGDGPVIVEVHSRQLDEKQVQALAEHNRKHRAEHKLAAEEARKAGKGGVVTSSSIGVAPFGMPEHNKPGDSILTNSISRICRTKEDETQIDPTKPFLLWLDYQDPLVWGPSIAEQQFAPIYSEFSNEGVGTGALWFALYGRKGDPMVEMNGCDYRQISMLHDGRFERSSRISAVIYSLPRATVLMEHPNPAMPLPAQFRAALLRVPSFRIELSLCEWAPGLVKSQIETTRNMVAAAAQSLVATNPP